VASGGVLDGVVGEGGGVAAVMAEGGGVAVIMLAPSVSSWRRALLPIGGGAASWA
jgi:hypothetical protein